MVSRALGNIVVAAADKKREQSKAFLKKVPAEGLPATDPRPSALWTSSRMPTPNMLCKTTFERMFWIKKL